MTNKYNRSISVDICITISIAITVLTRYDVGI